MLAPPLVASRPAAIPDCENTIFAPLASTSSKPPPRCGLPSTRVVDVPEAGSALQATNARHTSLGTASCVSGSAVEHAQTTAELESHDGLCQLLPVFWRLLP